MPLPRKNTSRDPEHTGAALAERDEPTTRVDFAPLLGEADSADPVGVQRAYERIRTSVLGTEESEVRLSRFVLLRQLDRGGMGTVFAAYDPALERKVAIKLLHPTGSHARARDSGQARLLREAQTIAQISHPNVVAIHDVGTYAGSDLPQLIDDSPEGGVFIVMELVAGRTLSEWLVADTRSMHAIVDVFVQAGRGLQAAHALGIVHRDFKPRNVMVTDRDEVRVLDFGLARAADTPESGPAPGSAENRPPPTAGVATAITQAGTTMGTPAYMAPEQIAGSTVDPRVDQYAYCVALYEALAGRRPFDGETMSELRRAKQNGIAPRGSKRARGIPSALYAVLERGLCPEPEARFPSVGALIEAVERAAGRRRRLATYTAMVGAAGMGIALAFLVPTDDDQLACEAEARERVGAIWSPTRADEVERALTGTGAIYAENTWHSVRDRLDAYAEALSQASVESCQLGTVSSSHYRSLALAQEQCVDGRAQRLDALLDVLADADGRTVLRAVAAVDSLPSPAGCAYAQPDDRVLTELEREGREAQQETRERLQKDLAVLTAVTAAGRLDEGLTRAEALIEQADLAGDTSTMARAHYGRALIKGVRGDFDSAVANLERTYELAIESGDRRYAARAQVTLAQRLTSDRARYAEARRLLRFARADLEALGAPPVDMANVIHAQGSVDLSRGEAALGLDAMREAYELRSTHLGPDHALTIGSQNGVAIAMDLLGDRDGALEIYRAILHTQERSLGPDHPNTGAVRHNVARSVADNGDFESAIALARDALETFRVNGMEVSSQAAGAHDAIATFLMESGDSAEGLEHRRRALAIRTEVLGSSHPLVGQCRCNLGIDLHVHGSQAEALNEATKGLDIIRKALGEKHPDIGVCRTGAGMAAVALGRYELAQEHYKQALALWEEHHGPESLILTAPLRGLAEAALAMGEPRRAKAWLEQAVAKQQSDAVAGHREEKALATFALAELVEAEDPERALKLAQEAQASLDALGVIGEKHTEVRAWLQARGH